MASATGTWTHRTSFSELGTPRSHGLGDAIRPRVRRRLRARSAGARAIGGARRSGPEGRRCRRMQRCDGPGSPSDESEEDHIELLETREDARNSFNRRSNRSASWCRLYPSRSYFQRSVRVRNGNATGSSPAPRPVAGSWCLRTHGPSPAPGCRAGDRGGGGALRPYRRIVRLSGGGREGEGMSRSPSAASPRTASCR